MTREQDRPNPGIPGREAEEAVVYATGETASRMWGQT